VDERRSTRRRALHSRRRNSNVQDCAVLHGQRNVYPVIVGDWVTIGHNATVHGCVPGSRTAVLVGIGSVILNGCRIGEGSIIAAGAVVPEGTIVPPRTLWTGVPPSSPRTRRQRPRPHPQVRAETTGLHGDLPQQRKRAPKPGRRDECRLFCRGRERANQFTHSICQIGIASFAGGKMVDGWESLVNPDDYFLEFNIALHGIGPWTVAHSPGWSEVCLEGKLPAGGSGCSQPHGLRPLRALRRICKSRNPGRRL